LIQNIFLIFDRQIISHFQAYHAFAESEGFGQEALQHLRNSGCSIDTMGGSPRKLRAGKSSRKEIPDIGQAVLALFVALLIFILLAVFFGR
jgi:hypothetical protein